MFQLPEHTPIVPQPPVDASQLPADTSQLLPVDALQLPPRAPQLHPEAARLPPDAPQLLADEFQLPEDTPQLCLRYLFVLPSQPEYTLPHCASATPGPASATLTRALPIHAGPLYAEPCSVLPGHLDGSGAVAAPQP